jgi:ribonuclease Z
MLLHFLGTGAGLPSLKRNVSSIAVQVSELKPDLWLFDCGEGTQQQVLNSPFSLHRIERIFITHLHGDHIFGLPGLLASRSFASDAGEITVYGPSGLADYLGSALRISGTHLSYPLFVQETEPGEELEIDSFRVKVALLDHGLTSFGYRLEEPDKPGKLDVEKLQKLGIEPGPLYAKIKQGEKIVLDDGRTLDGTNFVDPPRQGRCLVILGDTRYCEASVELACGADILVHEATFDAGLSDKAYAAYHSTTIQAAQVAKEAKVGRLLLTHVSSRYKPESYPELLTEARSIFPNSYLAEDHLTWAI